MGMSEEKTWLSYAEAAKRVRRSDHTIRLWRAAGMPMEWRRDEIGQRYRVVELSVLPAWWRDRLNNWPAHQNRMRRAAIERGETPPPIPKRSERRQESKSDAPQARTLPERPGDGGNGSGEPTAPDSGAPARVIDPLADMATLRGSLEYRYLTEKLKDATPGCAGIPEFTADKVDAETAAMMADICAHCPLLARCEAFAVSSHPTAGFWAGQTWRKYDSSHESRPDLTPASHAHTA